MNENRNMLLRLTLLQCSQQHIIYVSKLLGYYYWGPSNLVIKLVMQTTLYWMEFM